MLDSEDLKINSFISILLSIFNEQDESSLPTSAPTPRLIEFKCGRSINHSIIQILDITVDKDRQNAQSPNSMEFKCGKSIHLNIIFIIPFITNEEYLKLDEFIMIVDNLGRFLNSNPPP